MVFVCGYLLELQFLQSDFIMKHVAEYWLMLNIFYEI